MNEQPGRDWQVLAWFMHDHLPYSEMVFFVQNAAVNLTWRGDPCDEAHVGDAAQFDSSVGSIVWRSEPRRKVHSFAKPKGLLIKNGEPCHGRSRNERYVDLLHHLHRAESPPSLPGYLRQLREAKIEEDERFGKLVREWNATPTTKSFDKWRSRQVRKIRDAALEAGASLDSFAEQENRYRQREMTESKS